jgi:hypothetical protein
MGKHVRQERSAEVPLAPDEVWDAIATGPGITSWFMGHNEVDGETVRTAFGGYQPELGITHREPHARFSYGTEPDEAGRFVAYEFLIEGRSRSSTVIRVVTSGFIPGDDWADEYEAMTNGGDGYFATLVEYLRFFAPRKGRPITVFLEREGIASDVMHAIRAVLGLALAIAPGDLVDVDVSVLGRLQGSIYIANSSALGVRTPNALLRFIPGFGNGFIAAHIYFDGENDDAVLESTWRFWLEGLLDV